jgi:hypothetical protein
MTADAELIFETLANQMPRARWITLATGQETGFAEMSRRVKIFDDCDNQPACYQAEHSEYIQKKTNQPYREEWECNWIIYFDVGKDPSCIPAVEQGRIVRAVKDVFIPLPSDPGVFDNRFTLNGLVYSCFISGRMFKNPGDMDSQGMLVIPIKLLVP